MAYDPKCFELAEHFLPSSKEAEWTKSELAQHIQDAVEGWVAALANYPPNRSAAHD